jgi:hypothetical protein
MEGMSVGDVRECIVPVVAIARRLERIAVIAFWYREMPSDPVHRLGL